MSRLPDAPLFGIPSPIVTGLVGSELPISPGGLRVAPAGYSTRVVSNGDISLLGEGTRLNAMPGGLIVVDATLGVERRIRRGKKLFLLSDFGDHTAQGEYHSKAVTVTRQNGVIADIISIPDISSINIDHGAFVTKQQLKGEIDTVCVTVVDPEVGTKRKPIAIKTEDNNILIGPNNGVLYPAAEAHGIKQVYELLPESVAEMTGIPISNTFHGRDFFGPAGALAASGTELQRIAKPIGRNELICLTLQKGSLLHQDRYGNLKISDEIPDGATYLRLPRKGTAEMLAITALLPIFPKFADARRGTLCAYTGSSGGLEIAVNKGNAARALTLGGFTLEVGQTFDYGFGFDNRTFRSQQN